MLIGFNKVSDQQY